MPSPTVSTVPTSATFASASKPSICRFRISEISAGRMSMAQAAPFNAYCILCSLDLMDES